MTRRPPDASEPLAPLEGPAVEPPRPGPHEEPPRTSGERETQWVEGQGPSARDTTPAVGKRGGPASWRRAVDGARVALARRGFGDAQWSYLFKDDTEYAPADAPAVDIAAINRAARSAPMPASVNGPIIKAPVWTWEVPLYFWVGGIAAGSSFVALACDMAGDRRSAETARKVALGAVVPAAPLLVMDLGRPGRFLNMLRIFKPRSPMNLGAWCLMSFSTVGAAAVAADVLRLRPVGRVLGAVNAVLGGYLGSYTGVLLASTAVPVWARSRLLLGPIFVTTATATGAAATRLALVATGLPKGHPTRVALGGLETAAISTELVLSTLNEHRLGRAGEVLHEGRVRNRFRIAKGSVIAGLALRFAAERSRGRAHHLASALYLAGGLAFRYAWMEAGKASAADHESVARMARGQVTKEDEMLEPRGRSRAIAGVRAPAGPTRLLRLWTETVRRISLVVDGILPVKGAGS